MDDDERLIRSVATGDDQALRTLFERHAPWVAGRLRARLPATVVEDVVQETFVAVWRGAGRYGGRGEVGAWIWGIARRQAALWIRKHGRAALDDGLDAHVEPATDDDPAAAATRRVGLDRALATLDPGNAGDSQRELVRLVYVEDRPLAEVAERLGIPTGTVKSRLFHVRRRLRNALEGGGNQ